MSRPHPSHVGGNTLNTEQIHAEILRFEGVHPCIYQVYDLLECLPKDCEAVKLQLRDQIVCIEGTPLINYANF
ncbi:hypothetical protein WR25_26128 [Diploscapter pachys]|uniref:Uncharacterized protein n=1 Tax=Diploscapter pachys TaxID=2018661 RepID=A0A2A2J674_9BILA|nr:hypothetical protein WR25_26128 [Diploscapter pachys]